MRRLGALLALVALASGCSMKKEGFVVYTDRKAGYSVEVPAAWTVLENSAGFNPGAQFLAPPPKGRKAVRRSMTVDFYAPDDKMYRAIPEFVRAQERPGPGRSSEPLKDASVGGMPAKLLVSRKPLPQSPEYAPQGTLVTHTLLFAAATGFYALGDSRDEKEGVPADEDGLFSRLAGSFKLLPPGR